MEDGDSSFRVEEYDHFRKNSRNRDGPLKEASDEAIKGRPEKPQRQKRRKARVQSGTAVQGIHTKEDLSHAGNDVRVLIRDELEIVHMPRAERKHD